MVILEIYLDVIFLENFLMDYILLMLTGKIMQREKKSLGMLLAAVMGSAFTVFSYILMLTVESKNGILWQATLQLFNFWIAYVMVKCAYRNVRGKQTYFCVGTMLLLSLLTGGILSGIMQNTVIGRMRQSTILMAIGTFLFGYLFLKKWMEALRERLFYRKCHLPVVLRLCGKQIDCKGLMDSGNSLYEPITGRPVIIVEEALLERYGIGEPETYFAIPYHAIGTKNGILKGVLADELEIPEQGEKKWQKVMLGIYEGKISRQDEYQVILHPKL